MFSEYHLVIFRNINYYCEQKELSIHHNWIGYTMCRAQCKIRMQSLSFKTSWEFWQQNAKPSASPVCLHKLHAMEPTLYHTPQSALYRIGIHTHLLNNEYYLEGLVSGIGFISLSKWIQAWWK